MKIFMVPNLPQTLEHLEKGAIFWKTIRKKTGTNKRYIESNFS